MCAVALAGCKNSAGVFQDNNEGGWFSKPIEMFSKPDWAKPASISRTAELGPKGPVGPDELVSADGRCAAPAPEAGAAPAAETAAAEGLPLIPGAPQVMGGIALGMTECQTVLRAGTPGNVVIGAGESGERSVVLTYLTGTWPGIYRFSDGRLKVIERSPAPPAPAKAPPKKKKAAKKTAAPQ